MSFKKIYKNREDRLGKAGVRKFERDLLCVLGGAITAAVA